MSNRLTTLYKEIRCPVCDGQSIEDSEATLAVDLRQLLQEMVAENRTDNEIRQFLVYRYGNEILLRPQLQWETLALWGLPLMIMVLLGIGVVTRAKSNSQQKS